MFGRSTSCLLVVFASLLAATPVSGQTTPPRPVLKFAPEYLQDFSAPLSIQPEPLGNHMRYPAAPQAFSFPQLSRAAGKIFSGTVTHIQRRPAMYGQAVETVAITIHVERAVRGVTPGQDFTMMQWIGLWSSGQRYRIGERVLLFLYPESKLGLTSSVGGPLGRFAVNHSGQVLLTGQHLSAFRTDPVLGGRSRVSSSDFARAVRRAAEEE